MYTERVMHFQQRLTNLLVRCFEEIEWRIIQYTRTGLEQIANVLSGLSVNKLKIENSLSRDKSIKTDYITV